MKPWFIDIVNYLVAHKVPQCFSYDNTRACHDEPCDGHFTVTIPTKKVLSIGYCWPTLHNGANNM